MRWRSNVLIACGGAGGRAGFEVNVSCAGPAYADRFDNIPLQQQPVK